MSSCKIQEIEAVVTINCQYDKSVFLHLPTDNVEVLSDFNSDFNSDFGTGVNSRNSSSILNTIKSWLISRM